MQETAESTKTSRNRYSLHTRKDVISCENSLVTSLSNVSVWNDDNTFYALRCSSDCKMLIIFVLGENFESKTPVALSSPTVSSLK